MEKIIIKGTGWIATLLVFAGLGYAILNVVHEKKPDSPDGSSQKFAPENLPDKFSSKQECIDAGAEKAVITPDGDVADGYYRKCLQDGTHKIVDSAYEDIQNEKAWEEYQRSNE